MGKKVYGVLSYYDWDTVEIHPSMKHGEKALLKHTEGYRKAFEETEGKVTDEDWLGICLSESWTLTPGERM